MESLAGSSDRGACLFTRRRHANAGVPGTRGRDVRGAERAGGSNYAAE